MQFKYYIKFFLIIAFAHLYSCRSSGQKKAFCEVCDTCDKYNIKIATMTYNFYWAKDISNSDSAFLHLDSALLCLDEALNVCKKEEKYKRNFTIRKLNLLSIKYDYAIGIELIKQTEDSLLNMYPYYKSVILKRFYAMQCQYKGDTIKRNEYIRSIIDDIQPYIKENQYTIDTLCQNYSNITVISQKSKVFFAFIQYYYYRSIIEDNVSLAKELDLLEYQKHYNHECLEDIKYFWAEDFLIFQLY
jgi:hypothetical protein